MIDIDNETTFYPVWRILRIQVLLIPNPLAWKICWMERRRVMLHEWWIQAGPIAFFWKEVSEV